MTFPKIIQVALTASLLTACTQTITAPRIVARNDFDATYQVPVSATTTDTPDIFDSLN